MRPWQHAQASARRAGTSWQEDVPLHEFVDVTKASLPDIRHRMVMHNDDLGPRLVALAFPGRPDAEVVARMHAREDLGCDVPVGWWLAHCDAKALPRAKMIDAGVLVERERRRAGLADADGPRAVLSLLDLPERFAAGASVFLAHAAGLAILRAVLGPARELPGERGVPVVFDPLQCAEAMIVARYRRIPELRELASALRPDWAIELDRRSGRRRGPRRRGFTFRCREAS